MEILETDKSRKDLANLLVDCAKEADIHNVIVGMTKRGILNHVNIRDWLKACVHNIHNHPDYHVRIASFGLSFEVFDKLLRKTLLKYFDRLPGGGELRRAAMMGFNLGA